MSRQRTITIHTPEGIAFSLTIAGPISRFLALAVDVACIVTASGVAGAVLSVAGLISSDLMVCLTMLASMLISLIYPIFTEWRWRGQTVGKKLLRLRVMDEQGLRLRLDQVVIRNIFRIVDALPYFYMVGGITSLLSEKGQRLGDKVANTIVIYHQPIVEPDFDAVMEDKYNSFRAHPHIAARLRHNINPALAGLALRAILRKNLMDDASRVRVFAAIRQRIEPLAKFPPESVEGLSDEQYVRNAVEVIFRSEHDQSQAK